MNRWRLGRRVRAVAFVAAGDRRPVVAVAATLPRQTTSALCTLITAYLISALP